MIAFIFLELKESSEFDKRKAAIAEFNKVGSVFVCFFSIVLCFHVSSFLLFIITSFSSFELFPFHPSIRSFNYSFLPPLAPFTPRSFHPRSFHPRSFHPRSFHPRSFHHRSFHPRSFHPRSFHSLFLSPSFLSLLVPFTLVPFTLVPFTLVSFTLVPFILRTFNPSFFPSLVPLTLSSSQTSFAAHFVSSLLSLFLPYRTSLLTLRTLHPPVPTISIPLPPPLHSTALSFHTSFPLPLIPSTLCVSLPSFLRTHSSSNLKFFPPFFSPNPLSSHYSFLPWPLAHYSFLPTLLPFLASPFLASPFLFVPVSLRPIFFASTHLFSLLSPFPFLMFIYSLPKANRWRKRGISLVPLKYGITWENSRFTAYVAIFRKDGTVSITHGGIEMGQGINTKVYIHHPTCHPNPEIISNYCRSV